MESFNIYPKLNKKFTQLFEIYSHWGHYLDDKASLDTVSLNEEHLSNGDDTILDKYVLEVRAIFPEYAIDPDGLFKVSVHKQHFIVIEASISPGIIRPAERQLGKRV